VDIPGFVAYEMDVPVADADRYLRVYGDTLTGLLAKGLRVSIDGFGAFEPAYEVDEDTDKVTHGVRFIFDTGRGLEHPYMETVLDDGLIERLVANDQQAVRALPDPAVAVPLNADSAARLLDLVVFSTLRLTDLNNSVRLANGIGTFYGTLALSDPRANHNTTRSNRTAPIVWDFSDDLLHAFEEHVYDSLSGKATGKRGKDEQGDPNANRYDFGYLPAAIFVQSVLDQMWEGVKGDVVPQDRIDAVVKSTQTAAADWNAARSNKPTSIMKDITDGLLDEAAALAAYGSHNASRSPRSSGIIEENGDDLSDAIEEEVAANFDYNSSRSNTTSAVASFIDDIHATAQLAVLAELFPNSGASKRFRANRPERVVRIVNRYYDEITAIAKSGDGDEQLHAYNFVVEIGEGANASAPATSHNASRSNRSSGIASDFSGGTMGTAVAVAADYNSSRSNTTSSINNLIDVLLEETKAAATSHNASRSNRSQGIISSEVIDMVGDVAAIAKATSHNASRSNRSSGLYRIAVDDYFGDTAGAAAPATSHNASRSNRSSGLYYNYLIGMYGVAKAPAPATSHNASRSNRSQGIRVDFEPGVALEAAVNNVR
jgi:nitroreductase